MADIQSAAQLLGRLVVEEAKYLSKVEEQVKELRDELDWMHCFLGVADASKYDNAMARRWVARIREFAYEAEDTIEKFLIRVDTESTRRRDWVKKYICMIWECRFVHQIGPDIDSLKQKISALTTKLNTYGIDLKVVENSSSWLFRRTTFQSPVEEEIIGRDDDLNNVVKKLVGETDDFKCAVLSICGESGVGKTFLANFFFHNTDVRKHFEAFAWAYVSSPCQSSAVQQDLLSSLTSKSKEQISQMTDVELKTELRKVLCKYNCLIVLDGLWGKEVWDTFQDSFPIASPEAPGTRRSRSKLLITNQLREVAKHVHPDVYIYPLEPLNMDQSKQLLKKKVENNPIDISDKIEEMLSYCEGLPLLISVLGGVLATKTLPKDREDVYKHIRSYMTEDHHQVRKWKRILELSYYDLPFLLKPSFLYLGYFLTNLAISKKKIIRLWEAEGLVSYTDDEMSEDTLEDIAEYCLAELVERSLVQVSSRGLNGKVKTFLVHNLMRNLCMGKATQGNLLSIAKVGTEESQSKGYSSKSRKSSKAVNKKYRRLAIYYSGKTSDKLPHGYDKAKHIRSLLFFNTMSSDDVLIPLKGLILKTAFNSYKLLRVLDIEHIELHELPNEVGSLIHLRYLSLRGSWVSKLPSTIKNLRCLQTLDLRVLSFVCVRIPDVLCRMERLLHLYLPSKLFNLRHKADNLRLEGLKNLETLSNFSNNCRAEDLEKLTNLRRFASSDFLSEGKNINPLLGSPTSNLKHLERVSLKLDGRILKEKPQTLETCRLRKLWVKGEVGKSITHLKLPETLIQLSFHNTEFQDDPMEVLGKLPSLKKLSLKHASYAGTDMKCSSDSFKELKYLTLKGLKSLEVWTVEKEAMPQLTILKINGCKELKMLPDGLEFVKSLQELVISFMPFSFFEKNNPKDLTKWSQYPKVKDVPCTRVHFVLDNESLPIELPEF